MAITPRDKVLLGTTALIALGSAAVFGALAWRSARSVQAPIPTVEIADTPYVAAIADAPPIKTNPWNAPTSQSRGRDWLYDTFTPPEIFYNARSKQFTVKPPSSLQDGEVEEAFGLELVSVRPEPFRLQLIGYVGEEGNERGMFENILTGEVFLAAAGRRVPNLALSISKLEVRAQPVALADSMTTKQRVATAVVRDEKNGRDVTLTHRARHFTGTVTAFVAAAGQSATREVRPGDVFKQGEATYRVDKVLLTPPSIEVTKEAPNLRQADRRTLLPRETDEPEKPDGGSGS